MVSSMSYRFLGLVLLCLVVMACSPVQDIPTVRGQMIQFLEQQLTDGNIWVYEVNGDIEDHAAGYTLDVLLFKHCQLGDNAFLFYDKKTKEIRVEYRSEYVFKDAEDGWDVDLVEYNRCGDSCLLDFQDCAQACTDWESKITDTMHITADCETLEG